MAAMRYYFAYGSNMDADQMASRCPGSLFVGRARLLSHSFLINERGVASVMLAQDRVTHGLLWTITPPDEVALDGHEGVAKGFYFKEAFPVYPDDGSEAVQALIYIASSDRPGAPRPGYLERIIRAAREHGFAREYIAELESWSGDKVNWSPV
jgi:cation transport regulator ChaC